MLCVVRVNMESMKEMIVPEKEILKSFIYLVDCKRILVFDDSESTLPQSCVSASWKTIS